MIIDVEGNLAGPLFFVLNELIVKIIICAIPVGVVVYLIRYFVKQKKGEAAATEPKSVQLPEELKEEG